MALPEIDSVVLREKLVRKIEANPGLKTGMLAEALGIAEAEVLRHWPDDTVRELDPAPIESIIRGLETLGTLYVVVRNATAIIEVTGTFGGFSLSGPYLNVATEAVHMHIKLKGIAALFAVSKPPRSPEGTATHSLQFFDAEGTAAFKVFLMESMSAKGVVPFEVAEKRFVELVG